MIHNCKKFWFRLISRSVELSNLWSFSFLNKDSNNYVEICWQLAYINLIIIEVHQHIKVQDKVKTFNFLYQILYCLYSSFIHSSKPWLTSCYPSIINKWQFVVIFKFCKFSKKYVRCIVLLCNRNNNLVLALRISFVQNFLHVPSKL